jgi:error-prone DNA polymerase
MRYHCRRTGDAGRCADGPRPGSAPGVVFVTLEDETGSCSLVVWPAVLEAFRRVVMAARLVEIAGRIQRSPEGVTHLVTRRLADHSDLLAAHDGGALPNGLALADEIRRPSRDVLGREVGRRHPRDARILPKCRDIH